MKEIELEVGKGADLIDQLLSLGRRQFNPKPVDLNLLIDKIIKIFRFSHKNLRLNRHLAESLPAAEVDPGKIEQVLSNILLMTRRPGAKAQEVVITTEQVTLTEEFCQAYHRLPGPYIYIAVNAPHLALDDRLKAKIFEPFVMPDEVGPEVRPGLASVYSIIKNHQGIIEIDSEVTSGTTFHLYLPVCKRRVKPQEQRSLKFIRGTGTILLVDDEESMRTVGTRILERLGYKVITATTGQQALNLVQQRHQAIDLVVLDMILPGLSGRETFYRLKEIEPGIKVLLYSAHSMDEEVHLMLERGALGFIQKPHRLAALSQKIAEMLGQPGGSMGEFTLAGEAADPAQKVHT